MPRTKFTEMLDRIVAGETITSEERAEMIQSAERMELGGSFWANALSATGQPRVRSMQVGSANLVDLVKGFLTLVQPNQSTVYPGVALGRGNPDFYARFGGYSTGDDEVGAYFTTNAHFDGTNWNLDDTSKAGAIFNLSTGAGIGAQLRMLTAGSNPRTPITVVNYYNDPPMTSHSILRFEQEQLTIAGGVVAISKSVVQLDTQDSDPSDDLDTINFATGTIQDGTVVVLRTSNDARDVVVKNGTGNILIGADDTLSDTGQRFVLMYDGANWRALSRDDN